MEIQKHAWAIAQAVGAAMIDGENNEELSKITLSQYVKIRDIVENETYEYLTQLEQDGKLQIRN